MFDEIWIFVLQFLCSAIFEFQQAPTRLADYKQGAGGRWAQPLR
jgi:hypothetical protein